MTIKTYTVSDDWADAEVTFSIDEEDIDLASMQETCTFWSNSEAVLEVHNNDTRKAFAAYIGKLLLCKLMAGEPEHIILCHLSYEEGFLLPWGSVKIINSSIPEICSTHDLSVKEHANHE